MSENKKTVLLVDGEVISAEAETTLLEKSGYAVIAAATFEKAVEALEIISGIDLVLVDAGFVKDADGRTAAGQILKNHGLPIVFLLSDTQTEINEDTQSVASGYAVKGSGGAALDACIKNALKLFEADRRLSAELAGCRRAEEELRARDEKLTLMVDGVHALLTYIDSDLRFVQVNKSYADWYGLAAKDIAGRKVGDLLAKDVFERALPNYLKALNGETVYFENRTLDKDGKESYVSVTLIPHFCGGRVTGFFGSITDITKRRQAEEEIKRQLLEKETLLKEVHHRIRNNITAISGILSFQASSSGSAEVKKALTDSIVRIKSMCVLYDKLLISDEYKELSAKTYIESLVDTITALFSENIKITVDKRITDFNLSSKILFSLGIIINELFTNVMKYAFAGAESGHIKIFLDRAGNHVTLSVKDNGRGLPEGFEINKSNGFGLRLVEMITQQLNGIYTIKSGCGTESTLKFDI
jgi:PAS domain S-box-containing protein